MPMPPGIPGPIIGTMGLAPIAGIYIIGMNGPIGPICLIGIIPFCIGYIPCMPPFIAPSCAGKPCSYYGIPDIIPPP